jgi:hypothetical protein
VILVDDLLVRPFKSLLELLQAMALDEMYDVAALRDELKENQLLYEIGERTEAEYRERKQELERELEVAEMVRSQIDNRYEVKR